MKEGEQEEHLTKKQACRRGVTAEDVVKFTAHSAKETKRRGRKPRKFFSYGKGNRERYTGGGSREGSYEPGVAENGEKEHDNRGPNC